MTDLTNRFPQHGTTGIKPPDGLDKSGGDQYEAEYFDSYADSWRKQTEDTNDAIQRRTTHLHGDRILYGLIVTQGGGSRDIDVSQSGGAYVNGQFTGTIDSRTITLSSNSTSSNRTDSVYVNSSGSVSVKQGTTTVPSTTYKLAEVTVSPDSVITNIKEVGLQRTHSGVTKHRPSDAHDGDTLYNISGSPSSRGDESTYEVWENGKGWQPLLFADGRQTRTDHQYYGGNNIYNVGNLYFDDGDTSIHDIFVNESGDTMTGDLDMSDNAVRNLEALTFSPNFNKDVRANINYYGSEQRFELYDADTDSTPFAVDDVIELNKTAVTDAPFIIGPEANTETSRILQFETPNSNWRPFFEYANDDKLRLARIEGEVMMEYDMREQEIHTRNSELYELHRRVATRNWTGENYLSSDGGVVDGRITAEGFGLPNSDTQLQETFLDINSAGTADPPSPKLNTVRIFYDHEETAIKAKRGAGEAEVVHQF